jgi:sugar O-acyltransferase (sialic acid O-acetyltransferase NeuD family)
VQEPEKIVVYGTAGVAREFHQLIEDVATAGAPLTCVGFLVDREFRDCDNVHELPVFGDLEWLAGAADVKVAIAIGATAPRRRLAEAIEGKFGNRFVTLRHPRAWTGSRVTIGAGSVVCAGALATTDIVVGRQCQLHVGCTIGHDTILGEFVTIAPGANVSGRVAIGDGTFVGAGAVILPDIKVGADAIIGAGAVVTRDVPDGATVMGVPARVLRR